VQCGGGGTGWWLPARGDQRKGDRKRDSAKGEERKKGTRLRGTHTHKEREMV